MTDLQIFNNDDFGKFRTVIIDSTIWFVGKDIAEILGYKDTGTALLDHVDEEDKKSLKYKAFGDLYPSLWSKNNDFSNKVVINESGLYNLVFESDLPTAKKFKHWVTSEVLPTIRKTGGYVANEDLFINTYLPFADEGTKTLFRQSLVTIRLQNEKIQEQQNEISVKDSVIAEIQPKATYLDKILGETKELLTATQIAQDYDMSAVAFNKKLNELHIQRKVNGQWILYVEHQGNGYVQATTYPIERNNGTTDSKALTKWTQKGRLFLYEELKKNDIIPAMDRE